MPARVFSQEPDLVAALPKLLAHARRFFAAEVEVLSASAPDRPDRATARVLLGYRSQRFQTAARFELTSRESGGDDRFAAEAAEARSRAGGMSLLASRCPQLWQLTALEGASAGAELELSALLASVALGPVLPADGSALYGVRGAMERAEKLASG